MNMSEVLAKHNIEMSEILNPDSLKKLVNVHAELLSTLTSEVDTAVKQESEYREKFSMNDEEITILKDFEKLVRSRMSQIMEFNPDLSIPLVNLLQEVKRDTLTIRDYHVSDVVRNSKPAKVKDSDEIAERKAEAESLRDAIMSVWKLLGEPSDVIKMKETKPDSKGKATKVPDLPRIPGGNTTGNVGRGAVIRQLQFEIDGERMPNNILFYDLLKDHVNNFATGEVIRVPEFKEMIEGTKDEPKTLPNGDKATFAPKGYENAWCVTVFGKTIKGWVDKD